MPISSDVWKYWYKGTRKYKADKTHYEVWCRPCIDVLVQNEVHQQMDQVANGQRTTTDPEETIKAAVIARTEPRCGKVERMWNHLAKECRQADPRVKALAQGDIGARAQKKALSENKENLTSALPEPSPLLRVPSLNTYQTGPPYLTEPSARPLLSPLLFNTPPPALLDFPNAGSERAPVRQRLDGVPDATGAPPYIEVFTPRAGIPHWTSELTNEFWSDLCCLMIACNVSWFQVGHPFFRHFFQKWVPGCAVPCRNILSGRILDEQTEKVEEMRRTVVRGLHGSGQSDGWKNVSKTHMIGSMVNVEYTPHILNTIDVSAQRKTAETLLGIVEQEMKYCMEVLKVKLVAWCTDASGDSLKMRKLLHRRHPWLVVLDCWAHQINLVVGDYFKLKSTLVQVVEEALEVVKWFNNHSYALGCLREQMQKDFGRILALILPVLTRWTSHFLCVVRLLHASISFRRIALDHHLVASIRESAGPRREGKAKCDEIFAIIKREEFWEKLELLRGHLEPFAIAACVTQANNARLDIVLLTLANLYRIFSNPSIDNGISETVLQSLEKRWAKADQPIFILSVVLNPYIRIAAFARNSPFRTVGVLWFHVKAAFCRFFKEDPDSAMREAFGMYVNGLGIYSDEVMELKSRKDLAARDNTIVNLVSLWREFDTGEVNGPNGIVKLAMYIQSIVANSAATERLFSKLGATHTKIRNRMSHDKVRKMTIVNASIVAQYGSPNQTRKRKYGNEDGLSLSQSQEQGDAAPTTTSANDVHSNSTATTSAPPLTGPSNEAERSTIPTDDQGDDESIPRFTQLVAMASQQETISETDDPPSATSASATRPETASSQDPTSLLLKNLFHYPSNLASPLPTFMAEFWQTGNQSLDAETQLHDIIHNTDAETGTST